MKILILASWYPDEEKPLNGIFFKEQAEALKKSGIDVCVLNIHLYSISDFFNKNRKIGYSKDNENNINVYRYKSYNFFPKLYKGYVRYYAHLLKKYISIIEKEEGKIDLIHIHSAFDAGIAYSISGIDIPYVITEHSSRYHRGIINKYENEMLNNAFSNAAKVITVGKGLSEKVSCYCKEESPIIIPNMVKAIDNKNIKLDKNKKKFRFFSLAFLNEYKGMDILIKAFAKNKDILDSCELFIGGDGTEREKLEELVKELGLMKNVLFLGELNREEVQFYMNNSDAFVLASRIETFGVVFIEAMIQGKPVIGTKTGGPDTFINDNVGITVDIDDIDKLAEAMNYIYKNYNRYDKEYIINYCFNSFSEDVIVNKLKKVYSEVIGEMNV